MELFTFPMKYFLKNLFQGQFAIMHPHCVSFYTKFARSHTPLFYKGRGRKMGLGGWGLTDTPTNISSFYLRNEFFFSLELRRHSEASLDYSFSPLAEANV